MGALYLKDLAAKTRRSLQGRILQGRGTGTVPYAYRIVRRPRHLLTGKIVCGVCERTLRRLGKDYLSCRLARDHGCPNRTSVRYARVEAPVVDALRFQLRQPGLLAGFAAAFGEASQERITVAVGNPDHLQRELDTVDCRIATWSMPSPRASARPTSPAA